MNKKLLFGIGIFAVSLIVISCSSAGRSQMAVAQLAQKNNIKRILYFVPEVIPDIEEIKQPTYDVFFTAASDKMMSLGTRDYLRIDIPISYDSVNIDMLREFCKNNDADVAVVPRVKYFKVGLGKYVFSNQVEVSLKLFDADGNFMLETRYDTFKGGGRMLGSAANSVKIGTKGALQNMNKELQNNKIFFVKST
ncbi:pyruvate decarboxylase [Soonwooa sp.]|uniref:pyruvate decarboxylase n=1 Tax=Soonwooa sp. TaxID=1938592 RepID=UPI0026060784|nr:pyruvate decarboxylase [Soonwooa sp.]